MQGKVNNYKNKYKGRSAIITCLLTFFFIFLLNLFGLEYKEPPLSFGFEVKFSQFGNENFESKKFENQNSNSKIEDLKENNLSSSVTEKKNELKKVETQKAPSDISLEKKDLDKEKEISEITRKVVSSFLKQGESKISDSTKNFDSNDLEGSNSFKNSYYDQASSKKNGFELRGRYLESSNSFKQECNEEGIVVVQIKVNANGQVIRATPGVKGSTNINPCLMEPAKKTALSYKWNVDENAPIEQIGYIVINFKLSE